jgi:serine/threonine-protein kinase
MASVWSELKRRNVVKVAMAYAVVGWLLIEIASTVLPTFDAPQWVLQTITFVIVLGFPLALIFAWAFELTPEGIKREKDVDRTESITHQTGQKLNYGIAALLVLAVGFILVDKFVLDGEAPQSNASLDSIAVLPFESSVDEAGARAIADGVQIQINTQLSKFKSLKVVSGTSEYLGSLKSLREIGAELNVASLLQGRLQREGNQVYINVSLIDAASGNYIWSEDYLRELSVENRFAVQKEMALAIVKELQITLSPEETARLNDLPTQNSIAYDYFLSGLATEVRYDLAADDRNALVIQQYERAIAEDPAFALAYARLTIALFYQGIQQGQRRDQDHLNNILANAQRALDLQPDLPEGHLALALYHYESVEFDRALAELAIAEQGLPNEPEIFKYKTWILRRMEGRLDEALEAGRRMVELDPRNEKEALYVLGPTYYWLRNYSEADDALDKLLVIRPDHARAHIVRASTDMYRDGDVGRVKALVEDELKIYVENGIELGMPWLAAVYDGDFDLALRYVDNWRESGLAEHGLFFLTSSYQGQTLQLAGQPERAIPYFEEARSEIEQLLDRDPDDDGYQLAMAEVAAGLGNRDEAIALAEEAMAMTPRTIDLRMGAWVQLNAVRNVFAIIQDDERVLENLDDYQSKPGEWSIEGLLPDPRFDFIRDDPRFVALVEKYRRK